MTSPHAAEPAVTTEPPQPPQPAAAAAQAASPAAATGTGSRLAWLDVLRGLAALAVVFNHFGYFLPSGVKTPVYQWINPGDYGVFVFFLISGYIVPASLERKGSVRTFWVSRLFRLYPLYLLAVAIAVALYMAHVGGLRGEDGDPETSILSQMLMMSNVLAGENVPNVVWSLSYEMIFYLLLTALFMARVHRRSSRYALGFAVAAVAHRRCAAAGVLHQQPVEPAHHRAARRPGRADRPGRRRRPARHAAPGRGGRWPRWSG